MIKIENLSYAYKGSRHNVFTDLSLDIDDGKVVGVLGKNGMGKSTLLYNIVGLLRPKQGSVLFDNLDMKHRLPEALQEFYLVPEEYDLPAISLRDYVKINTPFYPRFSQETLEKCLAEFELTMDEDLKTLSMGQKKKVLISFALAVNTRVLLLDEPTNGLDIPSKSQFRKVVSQSMTEDRTIIISTHQVHDVESLIDSIIMLTEKGLALNESVASLTDKYVFETRKLSDDNSDALFLEKSVGGVRIIAPRNGRPETNIDLELLFNAVCHGSMVK